MALWKQFERDCAAIVGGTRNPLSGAANVDDRGRPRGGDVIHPTLHIECKLRKQFALFRWWREVTKEALLSKKQPVMFLRERGDRQTILVCIDARFFQDLLANSALPPNPERPEPKRRRKGRIPKSELQPGPNRHKRQCNLCGRTVYLTRWERFCTPCKPIAASYSGVRRGSSWLD